MEMNGEKKKLPLMKVRNLAYDKSPDVRKKAYESELRACESVADVVGTVSKQYKVKVFDLR